VDELRGRHDLRPDRDRHQRASAKGAATPYAEHTIVGGSKGCVVLGVGARERHTEIDPDGKRRGKEGESEYTVDGAALRHGAGIGPGTPQNEAYSRFSPRRNVRYGGWLD
jgi:hypothetical protein